MPNIMHCSCTRASKISNRRRMHQVARYPPIIRILALYANVRLTHSTTRVNRDFCVNCIRVAVSLFQAAINRNQC